MICRNLLWHSFKHKKWSVTNREYQLLSSMPVVSNLRLRHPQGSRVDILCTQLYYVCFIGVLDEGCWAIVGCYNGSRYKKGWKPLIYTVSLANRKHLFFWVISKRGSWRKKETRKYRDHIGSWLSSRTSKLATACAGCAQREEAGRRSQECMTGLVKTTVCLRRTPTPGRPNKTRTLGVGSERGNTQFKARVFMSSWDAQLSDVSVCCKADKSILLRTRSPKNGVVKKFRVNNTLWGVVYRPRTSNNRNDVALPKSYKKKSTRKVYPL